MSEEKPQQTSDSIVPLSYGERWFVDGFAVLPPPGGIICRLCDMTYAKQALDTLRARGLPASWTHLIVRAAALGLARCPEAHQVMTGYRRLRPAHADIGLSVAGRTNYAPVLIIPKAEERSLLDLIAFLNEAVPATREKEVRDLAGMERHGWLIPFGPLRRLILRLLGRSLWFRRRLVGTFQITCLPGVDLAVPMGFYSGSALGVGRICPRVLAVDGQPVVRQSVWLLLALDHKSMDGRAAASLLEAIIRVLESDELLKEAQGDGAHAAVSLPALPATAVNS